MALLVIRVNMVVGYIVASRGVTNLVGPVMLKPTNYHVDGCDHDDVDVHSLPTCSLENFQKNLRYVMASPTVTEYKKRCYETGIVKPTIFLGIAPSRILGIPGCFG